MIIDQEKLQELCDKVDLLEYAEKTVDFQRRGPDEYAAHCLLHEDKTPSLMINPSKNRFFCHACHVGGTIINWLMTFEHMSFNDAVEKTSVLAGVDINHLKTCEALSFYKQLKRIKEQNTQKPIEREVLPESYLDRFDHSEYPQEWLDEGITVDAMKEYGICIDKQSNRICYPVYDNDGNLVTVKGRTRFKDYKTLRLSKYISYSKIQSTNFLQGMKQNRQAIMTVGTVIIFEGIKSGLKLASWGWPNNWLAAETSRLNRSQVEILLGMHIRDVTIAFDRDVEMRSIYECTALLRRFCNVYVVRDRYNSNRLLPGDKDSPVDAGREVWGILYGERRKL